MDYTEQELKDILDNHQKWLDGKDGGVRANLLGANLSRANLLGADLSGANLSDDDPDVKAHQEYTLKNGKRSHRAKDLEIAKTNNVE